MIERLARKSAFARELRSLGRDAALRRERRRYLAEGSRVVRDAVSAQATIHDAIATQRWIDEHSSLWGALRSRAERAWEIESSVLDSLLPSRQPAGVAIVVERPEAAFESAGDFVVVADGLADPGNLGTLARSAEAAGAQALLVCGDGVDPFHPRVVRAAAGSSFRLPIIELPREAMLAGLAERGFTLCGLAADAKDSLWSVELPPRIALAFGAEAHGLDPAIEAALEARLRIPMEGPVESLSVAAAGAVTLFEIARRRAN